jgi:hypothetical protein
VKTPEDQAESIINEWNSDDVEEDTTIDPDKGATARLAYLLKESAK